MSIPKFIYKIVPSQPSQPSIATSSSSSSSKEPILPASDLDISDQFIHMSTASQVPGTLLRFFSTKIEDENVIWLLKVAMDKIAGGVASKSSGDGVDSTYRRVLRWETPDGNVSVASPAEAPHRTEDLFPHLYFDDDEQEATGRRLWLRRSEVSDVKRVVSEVGSVGWESGLAKLLGVDEPNGQSPWLV